MEFLDQIPYLQEGLTVLLAAHAVALAIVNLTPTPVDNSIVAFAYKLIEWMAGIVRTTKAKAPNPTLESKPDNIDLFTE